MPNHEVHRIPHPRRVRNPVTSDVSLIKTMWNDVGEQGVTWKRDPRNQ
jgi:hypothetical protein